MPERSFRDICIVTWTGEQQLDPVYDKCMNLAHETDCLEEMTELLAIHKEQVTDCTELMAAIGIETTDGVTTITIPDDFDAIVILIQNNEVTLLEDGYLKLDPQIHEPLQRSILERLTRRKVRQIRLIRKVADRRGITLPQVPVPPEKPVPPRRIEYVVQPGDTLFLIARRFNVPLEILIKANPQIRNPNLIVPGEIIIIPKVQGIPPEIPPGVPHGRRYVVREGDSMFLIAQKFGISLPELIAFNPQIPKPNQLVPGQVIMIPVGKAVG